MSTFLSLSENQSHKSSWISHWLRYIRYFCSHDYVNSHRLAFSCFVAILSNFLERFTAIENRVIFHWGNLERGTMAEWGTYTNMVADLKNKSPEMKKEDFFSALDAIVHVPGHLR